MLSEAYYPRVLKIASVPLVSNWLPSHRTNCSSLTLLDKMKMTKISSSTIIMLQQQRWIIRDEKMQVVWKSCFKFLEDKIQCSVESVSKSSYLGSCSLFHIVSMICEMIELLLRDDRLWTDVRRMLKMEHYWAVRSGVYYPG